VLVFCAGTPGPVDLAWAIDRWDKAWCEWTAKAWLRRLPGPGCALGAGRHVSDAAQYVAKLQDGKNVGREVARGDLKAGRLGSLLPFELLEYFRATGDLDAIDVWHEFEHAPALKTLCVGGASMRALYSGEIFIRTR
jgi:hypothetical protein